LKVTGGCINRSKSKFSIDINVPIIGGTFTYTIELLGDSPEHPWIDVDGRYYHPEKIIPKLSNFVTGIIEGSDTTGAIVVILSNDTYYTFAGENGSFLINNVSPEIHDIVVNLDGYAPYKQRFIHSSNTTAGVGGILHLIPEPEAFRIEGEVANTEGNVVANVTVDVYDENGIELFTTLTDENGQYLVTVSEKHVYTVKASTETEVGSTKVSGKAGDVVKANITLTKKTVPVPAISPVGMLVLVVLMLIVLVNEAMKKK
jgi:hypothetical protein